MYFLKINELENRRKGNRISKKDKIFKPRRRLDKMNRAQIVTGNVQIFEMGQIQGVRDTFDFISSQVHLSQIRTRVDDIVYVFKQIPAEIDRPYRRKRRNRKSNRLQGVFGKIDVSEPRPRGFEDEAIDSALVDVKLDEIVKVCVLSERNRNAE